MWKILSINLCKTYFWEFGGAVFHFYWLSAFGSEPTAEDEGFFFSAPSSSCIIRWEGTLRRVIRAWLRPTGGVCGCPSPWKMRSKALNLAGAHSPRPGLVPLCVWWTAVLHLRSSACKLSISQHFHVARLSGQCPSPSASTVSLLYVRGVSAEEFTSSSFLRFPPLPLLPLSLGYSGFPLLVSTGGLLYFVIPSSFFYRDFTGSPVVKTLPSNAGDVRLIPGQGAKIEHASWPQNQNVNRRSNIVPNSVKTYY